MENRFNTVADALEDDFDRQYKAYLATRQEDRTPTTQQISEEPALGSHVMSVSYAEIEGAE